MNDERFFLANAYLDGELTAEERRIAEADPQVMTEVARLRALQSELRNVPAPSDAARESAIGAAMAEFGGHATSVPADTPAIPFRPRPAYEKMLVIAAAVVAVAGLGVIISQADLGGDSDDAATADFAEQAVAESTTNQDVLTATADADDSANDSAGETEPAVDAGGADESAATDVEEAATEMMDEDAADDSSEVAGAAADVADVGDAATAPTIAQRWIVGPQFDLDAPITDTRELGTYGVYLIDERIAGRLSPSPNTKCGVDDEILDTATVVVRETEFLAYISVIESDGLVFARETNSCAVVMVGSIFAD